MSAEWGVLDCEWSPDDGNQLLVVGWKDTAYDYSFMPSQVFVELADPSIIKVAFTKSDHRICRENGIEVNGPFHDLQAMAWTIDERTDLDLESVARRYGAELKDSRIVRSKGRVWFRRDDGELVSMGKAPMDQLLAYCKQDLRSEASLYEKLTKRLKAEGLYDVWKRGVVPWSKVLVRMEGVGLPIDVKETAKERQQLSYDVNIRANRLMEDTGLPREFNFASDAQLANFLFRKEFRWETCFKLSKEDMAQVKAGEWPEAIPLNLEPTKLGREYIYGYYTLKGLGLHPVEKVPRCKEEKCGHMEGDCIPSVSAKILRVHHFENKWVQQYVEYKKRIKVLQFLDKWLEVERSGRLYTHFNQTGTDTGRLSSSDPVNLQQVPSRGELGRMVRGLFQAPTGRVFVHGDFSQIEPRLMAHFSHDPVLMLAFERGEDIYESATVGVLGKRYAKGTPERQLIRTCFLAMGYGAREKKIQRNLAEEGFFLPYGQVKAAYKGLIEMYQTFWDWKEECVEQAKMDGYVETIGGHRRHISWIDQDMRWKSDNQAVNSLIQGSAADIAAGAMVAVDELLPGLEPVLAVHDEALWEIPELLSKGQVGDDILFGVRWAAEHGHGFELDVPLVFEPTFIRSWDQGK